MNENIKKSIINSILLSGSNIYSKDGENALDEYLAKVSNVVECDVEFVKGLIIKLSKLTNED